ncbi:MAG TPA: hypothetical protein P5144_10420 [Thermoanaerobaculia bacterium]|nr:hypothetical protein [Thermoanaerobaculia bacterium]
MPEIRAQEQLDEVTVTLMPYFKQHARGELLRTLRTLAGYLPGPSAQNHNQAWEALRTIVRAGR